ncbi:MAG: NAD(P)-dependent oxidoreductase, partial [Clostridiales bacterium]|nr:NAD(P)-dependent oxidoreductase [Clostridiales bacterium]
AKNADIIITMVSDTPDVEQVLFGENGLEGGLSAGKIVIDMSTISPAATRDFAKRLADKGATLLDAPVSGGDVGAINATLTIMVGGEEAAFNKCVPLFQTIGTRITHMGASGAGQATKMVNQVMVAACLSGVCEGILLAEKEGLDTAKVIDVISGGVGNSGQLTVNGPKIAARDFSPGFMIDLFAKDLRIVNEAQKSHSAACHNTTLALELATAVQAKGDGREGSQAIIKILEKM